MTEGNETSLTNCTGLKLRLITNLPFSHSESSFLWQLISQVLPNCILIALADGNTVRTIK